MPHPCLPTGPAAGVCQHLTALPGRNGIGELGAPAHAFVDLVAAMGLRIWQFLPLGPTAYGDSPYQPLSTFAGNELLVDLTDLHARGLLTADELAPLGALPTDHVDFASLIPAKWTLLHRAALRFASRASAADEAACAAFIAAHDSTWLHDYALFRSLKTAYHERPWPEWDPALVRREPAALAAAARTHAGTINRLKVIQFLFHSQWQALHAHARARDVLLMGDIPIYIALDSADAWVHPELLCIDAHGRPTAVAGVPPDYFAADGQLWGNPLYAWDAHAASGYAWWIARMRHCAALCDLVRVDHFRGFEAYWSVPATAPTARDGAWLPGPGHALFDALIAGLGDLPMVAEDLGVITPAVEALRDHYGIPGMRVLQFEVGSQAFDLQAIGSNTLLYTGTHDNDTTRGWFATLSDDERARVLANTGASSAEHIHDDLWRLALHSNAAVAMAPMQDLLGLGSEARTNTPGTSGPNWRWRQTPGQPAPERVQQVADMVAASGRTASAVPRGAFA